MTAAQTEILQALLAGQHLTAYLGKDYRLAGRPVAAASVNGLRVKGLLTIRSGWPTQTLVLTRAGLRALRQEA